MRRLRLALLLALIPALAFAATQVKTWSFLSGSEGLADAGNENKLDFQHESGDGSPAGSVSFTTSTKSSTLQEFARRPSTGETWETWGVPAGSTVTSVQITAWKERTVANTKLSSHTFKARIIGSGGSTVHSAGDLLSVSLATGTDASWQTGSAGSSRAVDGGSQASTTDVRLELDYTVTTSGGGGGANVDQRFDEISLTITYTAPSGFSFVTTY